jgi:hypothetical protein
VAGGLLESLRATAPPICLRTGWVRLKTALTDAPLRNRCGLCSPVVAGGEPALIDRGIRCRSTVTLISGASVVDPPGGESVVVSLNEARSGEDAAAGRAAIGAEAASIRFPRSSNDAESKPFPLTEGGGLSAGLARLRDQVPNGGPGDAKPTPVLRNADAAVIVDMAPGGHRGQ